MIGASIRKLDGLIGDGKIAARKSGKILLIEVVELQRYLASLPAAELAPVRRKAA